MNIRFKLVLFIEALLGFAPLLPILLYGLFLSTYAIYTKPENTLVYFMLFISITGILGFIALSMVLINILKIKPVIQNRKIIYPLICCGIISLISSYVFFSIAGNSANLLFIPTLISLHILYNWRKLQQALTSSSSVTNNP